MIKIKILVTLSLAFFAIAAMIGEPKKGQLSPPPKKRRFKREIRGVQKILRQKGRKSLQTSDLVLPKTGQKTK